MKSVEHSYFDENTTDLKFIDTVPKYVVPILTIVVCYNVNTKVTDNDDLT